jgi:hypothetical protein
MVSGKACVVEKGSTLVIAMVSSLVQMGRLVDEGKGLGLKDTMQAPMSTVEIPKDPGLNGPAGGSIVIPANGLMVPPAATDTLAMMIKTKNLSSYR